MTWLELQFLAMSEWVSRAVVFNRATNDSVSVIHWIRRCMASKNIMKKYINLTALQNSPSTSFALKCSLLLTDARTRNCKVKILVKYCLFWPPVLINFDFGNSYSVIPVSIGVLFCVTGYMFLTISGKNKPMCHYMRFRELSKLFKGFHFNKNLKKKNTGIEINAPANTPSFLIYLYIIYTISRLDVSVRVRFVKQRTMGKQWERWRAKQKLVSVGPNTRRASADSGVIVPQNFETICEIL